MITKQRLSGNTSLGDVSELTAGCDSNSEEATHEEDPMVREERYGSDQHSNDVASTTPMHRQRGSSVKKSIPGPLASDDSCNAVDNMLRLKAGGLPKECSDSDKDNSDLSFNGKIKTLTNSDQRRGDGRSPSLKATDGNDSRSSREKLNASYELLTKENNSLMSYTNEKSPDLFADDDDDDDDNDGGGGGVDDDDAEDGDNNDLVAGGGREAANCLRRTYPRTSGNGKEQLEGGNECDVDRVDRILLKRMQTSLSGIPPPPGLTYSDIDIGSMLTIYRSNIARWQAMSANCAEPKVDGPNDVERVIENQPAPVVECLMKPTQPLDELMATKWPELTRHRAHGVHYNRSTVTETFELLSLKYIERYVGAETSSSFNMTVLQSSAKKRNQRLKLLNQSPGRRLSHLARRRATFSSESLLNKSGSKLGGGTIVSAGKGAIDAGLLRRLNPHRACNNRQVLLDPKKSDNRRKNKIKTPKRRGTPSGNRKSPRRRTPGSSAKKLTLHRGTPNGKSSQNVHVPATRESSKRALFLSPQNGGGSGTAAASTSRSTTIDSDSKQQMEQRSMFSEARIMKSKRSLFSVPRATEPALTSTAKPTDVVSNNKRRRSSIGDDDDDDEAESGPSGERTEKIRRTDSTCLNEEDLTPRSLKFSRSKSFCVGLQSTGSTLPSSGVPECASMRVGGKLLFRANSEISSEDGPPRPVSTLTENHKKKLLWAVSRALQTKQINAKHELFKQHASNLVRVVKRLFLEFNDQTTSSTSEKLLKLANKHVYEVIQGKSVDEIYLREKMRIINARNMPKLQGYIAPEEYELRKLKRTASIASIDGLSPFDCSLSASQSFLSQSSSILSQGSSFGSIGGLSQQLSQTSGGFGSLRTGLMKPAASTGSVHTVGMGGCHGTTVLRENVDSELRQRSAKKQLSFDGKDNASPFKRMEKSLSFVGGNVNKLLVGGESLCSGLGKAKRQVSFD